MDRPISFAKLSGSGNDFICIDNRDGGYDKYIANGAAARLARTLCQRGLSVGADGVIFAEKSDLPPEVGLLARFFEPDGSQVELCGNGVACFTHWVLAKGWLAGPEVKAVTTAGVVRGKNVGGGYTRVCIPTPEDLRQDVELSAGGRTWRLDCLTVGVPHAVVYVEHVDELDVRYWGKLIRRHPEFGPRGVNANFVQVLGEGSIAMRTFEFGVEGETLACGTGSSAAAILAALRYHWSAAYLTNEKPVEVKAHSGRTLRVWFTLLEDRTISDVCLETQVWGVCEGIICPDLLAEANTPLHDSSMPKIRNSKS